MTKRSSNKKNENQIRFSSISNSSRGTKSSFETRAFNALLEELLLSDSSIPNPPVLREYKATEGDKEVVFRVHSFKVPDTEAILRRFHSGCFSNHLETVMGVVE